MKVKNKAKSLDNNWNKEINKTQTANSKSEKKNNESYKKLFEYIKNKKTCKKVSFLSLT